MNKLLCTCMYEMKNSNEDNQELSFSGQNHEHHQSLIFAYNINMLKITMLNLVFVKDSVLYSLRIRQRARSSSQAPKA